MLARNIGCFIAGLGIVIGSACSKKSDSKGAGDQGSKEKNVPETITNPAGVLALALDSFSSLNDAGLGATLTGSNSTALTEGENEFTLDDCSEHADPLARESDDSQFRDDSGRLRIEHPRAALQDAYCKISKNTGSPDSFLGTMSQVDMLLCIMGKGHQFDGIGRDITRTYADLVACLPEGTPEEDKEEMFGTDPNMEVKARITASSPPAYGDKDSWDGSIEMTITELQEDPIILKLLLKDSDGLTAIAALSSDGRKLAVGSYVVGINRGTGEAWFDSLSQRIRTSDGTSSNGWNRHATAYVKGEVDEKGLFKDVKAATILYSDISNNVPGGADNGAEKETDPLQYGTLYTVHGSKDAGFKSFSYKIDCTTPGPGIAGTCKDATKKASWLALESSGACNGAMDNTACAGNDGIAMTADSHTEFAMVPGAANFVKTEDWFATLEAPNYSALKLQQTQGE